MFQIKDFNSVVASMVAHMRATQGTVTDFSIGSVARTLVEAPAIELDEFYQRVLFGLLEAIPVAVFDAFDFVALPAITASGDVTFTLRALRTEPLLIPADSVVKVASDNRRYLVVGDQSIPAGQLSAAIRVRAEYAGERGNAATGEIDTLVTYLVEQVSVSNRQPIMSGRDEETTEDRKTRFVSFIGSLSRGTVYACLYAAQSAVVNDASGTPIERVVQVGIDELPGYAAIYIYGSGGLPSQALLDKVQATIDGSRNGASTVPGQRPVGVQVDVLPMLERIVNIPLRAELFAGVQVTDALKTRLRDAIARACVAVTPGGVLYVDQLGDAALQVRQVERVAVGLKENIQSRVNEVLLLGDLAVDWKAS